ncbi:MAG: MBL fold metallo-hydrolase [Promethearchaeota archaeon]
MKILKINEKLHDIRLDLEKAGIENFLSTWVYKDSDLCFLVDPGPTTTINSLKQALDKLSIKELDYILLTHVHIDHAGGTGKLISYYPKTQIICHPRGKKHLINPEILWEGSKKVLGVMAEIYGKIIPIPEERIQFHTANNIKIIETLGHAPHHQSYLFEKYLFVGEAAGIHKPLSEGFYIRPATPPIFDYDLWKSSIQKLLSEDLSNFFICYPHYGMKENAELMLKSAEEQLSIWVDIIDSLFEKRNQPNFFKKIISELMKKDEIYAKQKMMEEEFKKRESIFVGNCIKGILGYVQKKRKVKILTKI